MKKLGIFMKTPQIFFPWVAMGEFNRLLQDLHFELSDSVSSQSSSTVQEVRENAIISHQLDRIKMTEQWVKSVTLLQRQRCLSTDSYFGVETVCDKLKKSFLKPFEVTVKEVEELSIRLSQLKIKDSDVNEVSSKNGEPSMYDKGQDTCQASSKEILPLIPSLKISVVHRFRSRTVPLPTSFAKDVQRTDDVSPCNESNVTSLPCHPLPPVESMKGTVLDENQNLLDVKHLPTNAPNQETHPQESNGTIVCCSFRNENLFPSSEELQEKVAGIHIGPNRLMGSYENAEDYLKTHFYLLKEDFTIPLKIGISDYKEKVKMGCTPDEVKNLKLFHNVMVLKPCFQQNKLGLAIDMGPNILQIVGDKDFMNGSLVLITTNHFVDVIVGVVLSRNFQPLAKEMKPRSGQQICNKLMVQLLEASHFDKTLLHRQVLLAESKAFFPPYFYVMKIFQGMTDSDFPMKEFIFGSQRGKKVKPPIYLQKNSEFSLGEHVQVNVLKKTTWPCADVLKMNDSQLTAMQKALSEKLVLIQGPPGTGKTYVGWKIAMALLRNKQVWNRDGNRPMLLMCQTNHALDQFMELLVPICNNLIRVGSQSKSVILSPFNINRKLLQQRRKPVKNEVFKLREDLKRLSYRIQDYNLELKRVKSHGIIDLKTFSELGVVELQHLECFIDSNHFLAWLEEGKESQAGNSLSQSTLPSKDFLPPLKCMKHQDSDLILEEAKHCLSENVDNPNQNSRMNYIPIKYIISLLDIEATIQRKKTTKNNNNENLEDRLKYFQGSLSQMSRGTLPELNRCLWSYPCDVRWTFYRLWLEKLESVVQLQLEQMEKQYLSTSSRYDDLMQFEKLEIMCKADIVGMTTTGAARLYPVLCKLKAPIVIVEEAAEVLESHIVATITKHCQHLILLGDHKQLRPQSASYMLSKTHSIDVSLFERLLMNGTLQVNTLLIQHRMQPHISALLRPSIYTKLYDHDCTRNRPQIHGMRKNVYFFTHNWLESKNEVTGSYFNALEAQMTVELVRYLLIKGEKANDICIITAYRQQVTEIENLCKSYEDLQEVRVATIDNFQGEESKIVILSLVRNNKRNQIGFLKTTNRTCVALSRARDGLFILGNIQLLSHNSSLWTVVSEELLRSDLIGQSFPLHCSIHPQSFMTASVPDDFSKYFNGGCDSLCLFKLPCGHSCLRRCHLDFNHGNYRCMEHCNKCCPFGHPCQKQCWEECGPCEHFMQRQLFCGHITLSHCFIQACNYHCPMGCF